MTPHVPIVVVGLMGAGKTTLATALAERLDRPLRDSDRDLEREYGATAAELAATRGRATLHRLEAEHLLDAVGGPAVVAAAASVLDDADAVAALDDAFVVWVHGDVELLVRRFASGAHRPDLGDPRRALAEQFDRRGPVFERVADVVVEADGTTEAQVEQVAAALLSDGVVTPPPPRPGRGGPARHQ